MRIIKKIDLNTEERAASTCLPLLLVLILVRLSFACNLGVRHDPVFGGLPFEIELIQEVDFIEVNGAAIVPQEILLLVPSLKREVSDYFQKTHGADETEDFWEASFSGEVPRERLLRLALIDGVQTKVAQVIALELGIRPGISYQAMERELEKENIRRQEALANGREIFGPPEYTLYEFYLQDMRSLRLALIQRLEEMDRLKEVDKGWYPRGRESRMERMERTYRRYIDQEVSAAEVKVNRANFLGLDLSFSE